MTYTPPVYPTSIPSQDDFKIIFDDLDMYWARYHNQYNKEIRAIMTELGTLPKGTFASVRARLEALLLKSGSIGDLTTKDHHLLSGLGDDDHTQYYNSTRHTKTLHDNLGLDHGTLSGKSDDDHTQYYNATRHTKTLHDNLGLDHGSLSGLSDDDHTQYYNSSRHTKAVHDSLGINAATLDTYSAGNSANQIPISNNSLCYNLMAFSVRNYYITTVDTGLIPASYWTPWFNMSLSHLPFGVSILRKDSGWNYWDGDAINLGVCFQIRESDFWVRIYNPGGAARYIRAAVLAQA